MSILYLSTTKIPSDKAHTVQIMKICEAFAKEGEDVHLFIFSQGGFDVSNLMEMYGIESSFKIHQIKIIRPLSFLPKSLLFYIEIVLFLIRAKIYSLRYSFTAVITRDWFVALFFSKTFYNAHNEYESDVPWYRRLVLRRMRAIIAVNARVRDSFRTLGISMEKVRIVTNGVDTTAFSKAHSRRKENRKILFDRCKFPSEVEHLILYTGQFFPWKGVHILLDAAKTLPPTYGVLCIGGGAPQLDEYTKKYAQQNICLWGHVPHSRIAEYTTSADILVLPNVLTEDNASRYTTPIKLFEYMASGVPIVASDLSTIREVVGEDAVWYVPAGDAQALADMIRYVGDFPDEVIKKTKHSLELARGVDWQNRARVVLDIIHEYA